MLKFIYYWQAFDRLKSAVIKLKSMNEWIEMERERRGHLRSDIQTFRQAGTTSTNTSTNTSTTSSYSNSTTQNNYFKRLLLLSLLLFYQMKFFINQLKFILSLHPTKRLLYYILCSFCWRINTNRLLSRIYFNI